MIRPALQGEGFLADVRVAAHEPERLHLWWLGQSGFLVQWQGHHLLLDPYLSDSLTWKYEGTSRPHVRMTERVIAPERLGFVQVVTASHNDPDHLDAETIGPLLESNPGLCIVVPRANAAFAAERLGVPAERLTPIAEGQPLSLPPFTLHAVAAAREALERDGRGNGRLIGLVVEAGPWTLFHSGKPVCYPGLGKRLRAWNIDVALLPINGRDPARGGAGKLSGSEAVALARAIGARCVVPCHFEMFHFNHVSPAAFMLAAEMVGQPYRLLRSGARLSLPLDVETLA